MGDWGRKGSRDEKDNAEARSSRRNAEKWLAVWDRSCREEGKNAGRMPFVSQGKPALPKKRSGLGEDGEGGVCAGRGGEFVEGELAAGGHDVAAAGVADEGGDVALDEVFLEDVDDFG